MPEREGLSLRESESFEFEASKRWWRFGALGAVFGARGDPLTAVGEAFADAAAVGKGDAVSRVEAR